MRDILFFLALILCLLFGARYNGIYMEEFVYLILSLLYVGVIFSVVDYKYHLDILEPYPFCCLFMFGIFLIMPILDLKNGDIYAFGIDVMPYCIKGTLIFDLAFTLFTYGYFSKSQVNIISDIDISDNTMHPDCKRLAAKYSLLLFCVFYLISVYEQTTKGFSLNYIMTLGTRGTGAESDLTGAQMNFLGLFANSLLACWMIYLTYGKSKACKIAITILLILLLLIRTSRHIILDMIVAPIAYYYIVSGKRPKMSTILVGCCGFILLSGIIGFSRGSMRSGAGLSLDGLQENDIFDNLKFNLQIYKSYYGVLRAIPEHLDFYFGRQILYTIIMIVPRIIWPGKPYSYQAEVIRTGLNEEAVECGYAFPNLGEFYGDFGIIGAAICYMFFGKLLKRWKSFYCSKRPTRVSVLKYCILLPVCMQLIIRGAFYQNFYLVIFMVLPFWLLNKIIKAVSGHSFK